MSKWENFSVKHKYYYRFCCGVGLLPNERHEVPLGCGEGVCVVQRVELAHQLGQAVARDGHQHLQWLHNVGQSLFRTFSVILFSKYLTKQFPCCSGPASCCRWPRRRPPPRRGPRPPRPRPWSAARGGAAASRPSPSSGCSSTSSDGRLRVACRA